MNWKDYEKEIYAFFKSQYPDAEVTHNVTVEGRYSKTLRQIDILIEAYIAGNRMRIIVDGKYFSEKIDVKEVEMFIAMVHDCEAAKGLLITHEGYSKAALNRAYHDPHDIELDILNFKELNDYQGFIGIPYSRDNGVLIPAPFGWVIDATQYGAMLATTYQRGLTLEKAMVGWEFMYFNIKHFDDTIRNVDDLLESQNKLLLADHSGTKIQYQPTIRRNDATVKLRIVDSPLYQVKEYTGIVAFETFAFISVLFSPDEVSRRNIRKLENIMQTAFPVGNIEESFKWDVEITEKGPILSLDVMYLSEEHDEPRYVTIIVAIEKERNRPAFISIIVPSEANSDAGITLSFLQTKDDGNGQYVEHGGYVYFLFYEESTDDSHTTRIHNGILLDGNKDFEPVDIFDAMQKKDHLQVDFEYPGGRKQSVRTPLFSFKKQLLLFMDQA